MKKDSAWNELRRHLEERGDDFTLGVMDGLEKAEEPEYVYRLYWDYSPHSKNHARVGSKHRMHCIITAHSEYYRQGLVVERTPVTWTNVTKDFVK